MIHTTTPHNTPAPFPSLFDFHLTVRNELGLPVDELLCVLCTLMV